jgi:hypothetical protein
MHPVSVIPQKRPEAAITSVRLRVNFSAACTFFQFKDSNLTHPVIRKICVFIICDAIRSY